MRLVLVLAMGLNGARHNIWRRTQPRLLALTLWLTTYGMARRATRSRVSRLALAHRHLRQRCAFWFAGLQACWFVSSSLAGDGRKTAPCYPRFRTLTPRLALPRGSNAVCGNA